ncbi:MAG: hypothetical protein JETT_3004 [Candidatus Jettenia ecosi]|uniref:Uncharacterized protein n=1 Tax=Candidatus Jettenia ecosi TaxID=2494326 RepID=A0A533Q7W4_9BACT|nr:MAG: hypothetical protein JETT_3004 [Candidatus Jettenia ecosi]
MRKYYINGWGLGFTLFFGCFLLSELSYCLANEKKKIEHKDKRGVMIVSLNIPLRATLGNKIYVETIVGNERTTKVTTILTVTCLTTDQIIGREAETLDGLSSHKIVYCWDTKELKEDSYLIRAELEEVPGEMHLDDNVKQANIFLVP